MCKRGYLLDYKIFYKYIHVFIRFNRCPLAFNYDFIFLLKNIWCVNQPFLNANFLVVSFFLVVQFTCVGLFSDWLCKFKKLGENVFLLFYRFYGTYIQVTEVAVTTSLATRSFFCGVIVYSILLNAPIERCFWFAFLLLKLFYFIRNI